MTEPSTLPLHLFEATGVEIETMIVSRETLDVLPCSDLVLRRAAGTLTDEVESGELAWSNELVMHVIELKTNGPAPDLGPLAAAFHRDVLRINDILGEVGGMLMPTAMHPWMEPLRETRLWPHGSREVYAAYDRIFGCQGHGWANLQSVHINLPFADDDEFARLHAAIRLVLPLIPAIAASSPLVEGRAAGSLDHRLVAYRQNQRRLPILTGEVIPEPVWSRAAYEREILERAYHDLRPFDPDGILAHEWVNSRGAIARFDRMAIEIRLVDAQECPLADLAVVAFVVALVRGLCEGTWSSSREQQALPTQTLKQILEGTIAVGPAHAIADEAFLRAFGLDSPVPLRVGEALARLSEQMRLPAILQKPAARLLQEGPLASRILSRLGKDLGRRAIFELYEELCECLATNRMLPGKL